MVSARQNLFWIMALIILVATLAMPVGVEARSILNQDYLVLSDDGKPVFVSKIRANVGFAIHYIHSVAKSPVTDYFKVRDGVIYLDRTVYEDFGAGLPHNPEPGQKMTTSGGRIAISGYNRALPEFEVRVGRVANLTLLLLKKGKNGKVKVYKKIPLDTLAAPGKALAFSISREMPAPKTQATGNKK